MRPTPYGPFPYIPINSPKRPKIRWPDDATIALWIVTNIEFFSLTDPVPGPFNERVSRTDAKLPSVLMWSYRDYGNRVGIWRMMDLFERRGIRSTVALNSAICDYHPEIVSAAAELRWEFMGHGYTNAIRLNEMPPEDESSTIAAVFDRIEKATGKRPRGWLGSGLEETWNTLDYLVEQGCEYVADWKNDDQPYLMNIDGKRLVSLPYSWEVNDVPQLLSAGRSTGEFEAVVRRTFDVLRREAKQSGSGRVMCMALHPYTIGVPHHIDMLDSSLAYIQSHPDVWCATGGEIVEHWLRSGATF